MVTSQAAQLLRLATLLLSIAVRDRQRQYRRLVIFYLPTVLNKIPEFLAIDSLKIKIVPLLKAAKHLGKSTN